MKIIIEKHSDKLGDDYLHSEEVIADVRCSKENVVIEVDDVLYIIPKQIFIGLELNKE